MKSRTNGFTLLEVLIALFIFSLAGVMLGSGLRTVINFQEDTEKKAARLRELQMALLIFSRDLEQTISRPIVNAGGKDEAAFVGTPQRLAFTHTGSVLRRTAYEFLGNGFWRITWPVLDQAPKTPSRKSRRMRDVIEGRFEYLDARGRFHEKWPPENSQESLPRGVQLRLTINHWGSMTQFYLIPARDRKANELLPS